MKKIEKEDLSSITGGTTSGTLYKYSASFTVNGQTITLEKDGFYSEAEAKSAAKQAVNEYLSNNSITTPIIPIIVVTKYLLGESDPFVIKPTIAY